SDHLTFEGQKQKVHSLVEKVYSRKNLTLAWERVRANRGAGGYLLSGSREAIHESGMRENCTFRLSGGRRRALQWAPPPTRHPTRCGSRPRTGAMPAAVRGTTSDAMTIIACTPSVAVIALGSERTLIDSL